MALSKLQFYTEAKQFFSKKENKFNCPMQRLGPDEYPKGLCKFLDSKEVGRNNKRIIENAIRNKVRELHSQTKKHLQYLYFPTHKQRMEFIDEQIELLTKK